MEQGTIPRMRTAPKIVAEIKALDPGSEVTEHYVRQLVKERAVPVVWAGSTVVFTPIGTALSIVLARVVDKNRAENTSATGDGVVYAAAQAAGFVEDIGSENSPAI